MEKYEDHNLTSIAEEAGIRFYSSAEDKEMAQLREAINRSDTDKFYHLMNLMKLQKLMITSMPHKL